MTDEIETIDLLLQLFEGLDLLTEQLELLECVFGADEAEDGRSESSDQHGA